MNKRLAVVVEAGCFARGAQARRGKRCALDVASGGADFGGAR